MAKKKAAALTAEQLDAAAALNRGSVNTLLAKRKRHVHRIHVLSRVLDPKDTTAVMLSPHEDGYRDELERRQSELAEIDAKIIAALGKED